MGEVASGLGKVVDVKVYTDSDESWEQEALF
mgnify:CR=1 FL=1